MLKRLSISSVTWKVGGLSFAQGAGANVIHQRDYPHVAGHLDCFFAAVGCLAFVLVLVVHRVVTVSSWEAADATVLTSSIRQVSGPLAQQDNIPGRDFSFRVEIEYAYRYGGEDHIGDTVFRGRRRARVCESRPSF